MSGEPEVIENINRENTEIIENIDNTASNNFDDDLDTQVNSSEDEIEVQVSFDEDETSLSEDKNTDDDHLQLSNDNRQHNSSSEAKNSDNPINKTLENSSTHRNQSDDNFEESSKLKDFVSVNGSTSDVSNVENSIYHPQIHHHQSKTSQNLKQFTLKGNEPQPQLAAQPSLDTNSSVMSGTSVSSGFSEPNPQGRPLVHYAYDKNDTCVDDSDVKSSDKNGDNTICDKVIVGRKLPDFSDTSGNKTHVSEAIHENTTNSNNGVIKKTSVPVLAVNSGGKHVKIHDSIEVHEASDTNSESDRNSDAEFRIRKIRRESQNTTTKKEIIGILKSPTSTKSSNSFPSLPDSFLHDLGLFENISISTEHLSEKDIENKFSVLSLALKTDRVTLSDRLDLQLRQRDLAERNVTDEIKQLKTTIKSLNQLCQSSDTREILERISKQISIVQQSTSRVASSAEQYGAVQQEMRISTAVDIMLLHLENIKRNYEREHSEHEETKRVLIKHKLIEGDETSITVNRHRSISVLHSPSHTMESGVRRASVATSSHNNLTVDKSSNLNRPKSPTLLQMVSANTIANTFREDLTRKLEKKTSVFTPIQEESKNDSDSNNNGHSENKNSVLQRRKESRKISQFDVDTIIEEIDELAVKRDSSPVPAAGKSANSIPPNMQSTKKLVMPTSALEVYQRKKSLLVHFQNWYSDLYWPYDEEETLLGIRYGISALLAVAAFGVFLSTLIWS